MPTSSIQPSNLQQRSFIVLGALLALFAVGVLMPIFPQVFPMPLMAAAQAIPAFLFVLIHGANAYRVRGIFVFVSISLVIGYIAEALGVHIGFPFGQYHFTAGMGPKIFEIPILMGPAYVGMGYVSWTLARVITRPAAEHDELTGLRVVALPLAASFIMVAWDIAIDPVLSTFAHYWTWTRGGAFFGVPVSNFLGWYGTNYLIYQLFALYLRRESSPTSFTKQDRLAVLFYAVCAAGIALRALTVSGAGVTIDPSGNRWRVSDINAASALAAFFLMGAFVTLALVRFGDAGLAVASDAAYRYRGDLDEAETTFARQDEFEQMK